MWHRPPPITMRSVRAKTWTDDDSLSSGEVTTHWVHVTNLSGNTLDVTVLGDSDPNGPLRYTAGGTERCQWRPPPKTLYKPRFFVQQTDVHFDGPVALAAGTP